MPYQNPLVNNLGTTWNPKAPVSPRTPTVTSPVTPTAPFVPDPVKSTAFLTSPAFNVSGRTGQTIWNPTTNSYMQIGSQDEWGWDPSQFSMGVNTPGGVWEPTEAEMQQYRDYWSSPAGAAVLKSYGMGGANYANPTVPPGTITTGYGAGTPTQGQGAQGAGNGTKITVTLPDGSKVTGPAESKTIQDAIAAANQGTGTGTGGLNYPMNPLGDVSGMPNILAQNKLLEMMQQDPYLSGLLQPYLNQAYSAIGRSGMPTSSYTDQMLAETIAPMYLANQQNVLAGYANLSPQLIGLSQEYRQPFETAMDMLYKFFA